MLTWKPRVHSISRVINNCICIIFMSTILAFLALVMFQIGGVQQLVYESSWWSVLRVLSQQQPHEKPFAFFKDYGSTCRQGTVSLSSVL
jgi:hypothetical protein